MLSAFILLFQTVLTFIILGIKMPVSKNLIFLPLGLIAAYSCLPDFPWWLELIYFHLLPANEISLTFLHETLQRILLTVLNSFPPLWQLYAQWGVVRGCGEFCRLPLSPASSPRNRTPCGLPHFHSYIYCSVYPIECTLYTCGCIRPLKSLECLC